MLLLVAYDLHNPGRSYPPVEQAIKEAGNAWAHIEGSVWIVDTLLGTQEVMERVRAAADANDTVFVVRLQHDWWSVSLSAGVVDWLKDPARRW